jgi:hypothetical protein
MPWQLTVSGTRSRDSETGVGDFLAHVTMGDPLGARGIAEIPMGQGTTKEHDHHPHGSDQCHHGEHDTDPGRSLLVTAQGPGFSGGTLGSASDEYQLKGGVREDRPYERDQPDHGGALEPRDGYARLRSIQLNTSGPDCDIEDRRIHRLVARSQILHPHLVVVLRTLLVVER